MTEHVCDGNCGHEIGKMFEQVNIAMTGDQGLILMRYFEGLLLACLEFSQDREEHVNLIGFKPKEEDVKRLMMSMITKFFIETQFEHARPAKPIAFVPILAEHLIEACLPYALSLQRRKDAKA